MRLPTQRSRGGDGSSRRVGASFERAEPGIDYYDGVVIGPGMIGDRALSTDVRESAMGVLSGLNQDDYSGYLEAFIARGIELAGPDWRYADIITVLRSCAELLDPSSYLEIGVRGGRSMAMVAEGSSRCDIVGIDMWMEDYAGMENPGPDHIRREMERLGHTGELELISGNSHEVLPKLFRERPELTFELITVDGDHSPKGARADLTDVLPRLRVGGALVFDDIRHPAHPELYEVWGSTVRANRRYACWEFDEVGYGVAVAVRRW